MDQRRALIGSLIGIFVFTIITWVNGRSWESLESQVLQGQSAISLFNQNRYSEYVIFDFDENSKLEFTEKNETEQKDYLLSLVNLVGSQNANTAYLLVGRLNPLNIQDLDLEMSLDGTGTQAKTINFSEVQPKLITSDGELWLDQKQYENYQYSTKELIEESIPSKLIPSAKVIIISPELNLSTEEINLLINFLNKNWVTYYRLPKIILFLICAFSGVFLAAFVYWARILVFFGLLVLGIIAGQIGYNAYNLHLELIPAMVSLVGILLLSNLFDLNLIAINRKEIFKSQIEKNPTINEFSQISLSTPFLAPSEPAPAPILEGSSSRSKLFLELEDHFEDIALQFQEKTLRSVDAVQEKISELLESNEIADKDAIKVSLLRHGFDNLIEDIDAILFNLVPFKFEGEQGLINIIELYASKIFLLSKGKLQIGIETEFPVLKFEKNQKINIYRILQKLVDLIRDTNTDKIGRGLNIGINISTSADDKRMLKFRISYEGKTIDQDDTSNLKLNEIYQRVSALPSSSFTIKERSLAQGSRQLTNYIELTTPKPAHLLGHNHNPMDLLKKYS
jgi:hypothetical protein